uniref:Uncharacterized protein n=1 Tax=Anopheles melas TaxID=34690 RepID=A0A182UAX6_9DIPT
MPDGGGMFDGTTEQETIIVAIFCFPSQACSTEVFNRMGAKPACFSHDPPLDGLIQHSSRRACDGLDVLNTHTRARTRDENGSLERPMRSVAEAKLTLVTVRRLLSSPAKGKVTQRKTRSVERSLWCCC